MKSENRSVRTDSEKNESAGRSKNENLVKKSALNSNTK